MAKPSRASRSLRITAITGSGCACFTRQRNFPTVWSTPSRQWNKKEFSKADGVLGKTRGIVGVGQIGREVIKRAHAFGLPVIAWSRSLNLQKARDLGVEYCPDLDTLFRRSDIISLHV